MEVAQLKKDGEPKKKRAKLLIMSFTSERPKSCFIITHQVGIDVDLLER